MEIIELLNAYRQASGPEKELELAELLYNDVKQDLRVANFHKVPDAHREDILQDTLIAVFNSLEKFRGKTRLEFRQWCNRIFFYKKSDFFRDRYNAKREPLPPDELLLAVEKSGEIEPISREEKLDLEDAMNMVEKIRPGCGKLLWKRWVAGMKPKEIAKGIRLESNVVRMRIDRCLEKAHELILKLRRLEKARGLI
jgi:RNA polymerase sigma factor (sigma-70 family)